MPLYDLECTKCTHKFEAVCKIAEREAIPCPKCGGQTQVLITGTNRDWFRPNELWEDFTDRPVEVTSKAHLRELCKRHGVYAKALD